MSRARRFQVSEQLGKLLLLDDIRDYRPDYDPYIYLGRSLRAKHPIPPLEGGVKEYVGVESLLAPVVCRTRCAGKIQFPDVQMAGRGHFENDGTYVTGERFEWNGIPFEIIVHDRFFDGLDLSYYEPTDRLITYLELHREERQWINPYTNDVIIKSGDGTRGWEPHDQFLSIRKSELADYLAARKCGLLVLRYSERLLETPLEVAGVPEPFSSKKTKHGHQAWIIDDAPTKPGLKMYFSRLWESFWIPPASKPRRWDPGPWREFKDGVTFVLKDGETSTFGPTDARYFELISFRPVALRSFSALPRNRILWSSLTCCDLRYADGSDVSGCINSEGQFQVFFGLLAKLGLDKQRHLSGYSEPWKAKPSYEYIRANIDAEWPETRPLGWTLSGTLREVNTPWSERFGETLLLTPAESDLPDILGPVTGHFNELADVMLELQKTLVPEATIDTVKAAIDLSDLAASAQGYAAMKSVAYLRLLFRRFGDDKQEGTAEVLQAINDLRNCKGHPKRVDTVLERYRLDRDSPRLAYLELLRRVCLFLAQFRRVTQKALNVEIGAQGRQGADDPWHQLKMVAEYCRRPF